MSEEIKELIPTPDQIEKGMIEKELATPHVLDNHAAFCALYFPKLMQYCNKMSNNQLLRLIELSVKHPIEESHKKLLNQAEKSAFNILTQLQTSKQMMILQTGIEEMDRQAKEQDSKKVSTETIIETTFGEENGTKDSP